MSTVFLRFPFPYIRNSIDCEQDGISYSKIHSIISTTIGLSDFSLHCNGKKIHAGYHVLPYSTLHISFPLPGGKGGFGSMLRAIGAQIEKTTNREACRDLSGRRLRDINEEQRLKNWIAKKSEREAEKLRRRKERLERLKSKPKHNFVDFEYEKEISELPERIDDALSEGIEKAKKRPTEITEPSTSGNIKKKRLWLDEEISESSESDSDSNSKGDLRAGNDALSSVDACSDAINVTKCSEDETSNTMCSEEETSKGSLEEETQEIDAIKSNKSLVSGEVANVTINLNDYQSIEELEALGLEPLKKALLMRGLKCGGSLTDRAQRLWAIRGLSPDQYPKNFRLAKQKSLL